MWPWFKKAFTYKWRSFGIIFVLIISLVMSSFIFREKVQELMLSEVREIILTNSQSELINVNQRLRSIIGVMLLATNTMTEDGIVGSTATIETVDSVMDVTGFSNLGIVDINGNNVYGFSIDEEDFKKIKPTFHGITTIAVVPQESGEHYDILLAVPFEKDMVMQYIFYARISDVEFINFVNQGRTLVQNRKNVMSFLLFNVHDIVHINNSSRNRSLPLHTPQVLQDFFHETDSTKLSILVHKNHLAVYTYDVEGYPLHFMTVMPSAYEGLNFVTLIPAEVVTSKVSAIMFLFTILATGIVALVAVLLIYYEYVVNSNRSKMDILAYYDDFTKLPNKAKLSEEFAKAKQQNEELTLFVVKFQIYNHNQIARLYGHNIANKFELAVARYLKENPLQNLFVARVNEYFVALIYGLSVTYVRNVLLRLFNQMDSISESEQKAIFNCGVVACNVVRSQLNRQHLDLFIDNCDMAMSMSGHIKEHTINLFDKKISDEILRRDALEKDLEPGLSEGEFLVYLQPKYDMSTNKLAGAEALIRWNYKKKGILPPFKFIPVFEQNGSIALIDNFVLQEVIKLLKKWRAERLRLVPISVNLSQVQFLNPNLINDFKRRATRCADVLPYVDIEITESATVEDFNHISEVLHQLKEIGVKLSMDDFGTGYSSLANLSSLPFDTIKIDKSFVDKIDTTNMESVGVLLVKDIISIITHFRMSSLVEGVETIEQRDVLRSLGCKYCQGYYYSKPLPIADFEKLLREDKTFIDVPSEQVEQHTKVVQTTNTQQPVTPGT